MKTLLEKYLEKEGLLERFDKDRCPILCGTNQHLSLEEFFNGYGNSSMSISKAMWRSDSNASLFWSDHIVPFSDFILANTSILEKRTKVTDNDIDNLISYAHYTNTFHDHNEWRAVLKNLLNKKVTVDKILEAMRGPKSDLIKLKLTR